MGDAVGDGAEFFGRELVIILEGVGLEDFAVKLAHTVHRIAHGHTQVCHLHHVIGGDGHFGDAGISAVLIMIRQPGANPTVNLLQNHIDSGQQRPHHGFGPALQRFAHDGMVGIGHGALHDAGGFIPAQAFLIHQQTHQLGNRQARMGVVDVNGHFIGQQSEIIAKAALEILEGVLEGGAGEEIMLLEPQLLALVMVVLGIEHLADHRCQFLLLHGLGIIAVAEGGKIQRFGRPGAPHAQGVHGIAVIASHGHIIGHGFHGVVIMMDEGHPAVLFLGFNPAAEMHLALILHGRHFPDVAVFQPVVRHLHLLAADNPLAEQAVLIADGAAHGRQGKRGQAVHKASGQTAQPAVAQAGFGLLAHDVPPVQPQLIQGFFVNRHAAQVQHIAVQAAAGQKFHGQVIEPLILGMLFLFPPGHPFLHDLIPHGRGQGIVNLLLGGFGQGAAVIALQLADNGLLDGFFIELGGRHLDHPSVMN